MSISSIVGAESAARTHGRGTLHILSAKGDTKTHSESRVLEMFWNAAFVVYTSTELRILQQELPDWWSKCARRKLSLVILLFQ